MAKVMADHVLIQMRKTQRIKEQWVNFVKIELSAIFLQPSTLLNGRIRGKIGSI